MSRNTQAIIVNGLSFGDEGKGTIVDAIVRRTDAHTVVRYNGGPQAGHNVVTKDGRHHTFAQFGAGTLAGASTFLSRFMCIAPVAALAEAEALARLGVLNPLSLVSIDEHALVITPFHRAANRLRELLRGVARHGSCGVGVGETMADLVFHGPDQAVFAADLRNPSVLYAKLSRIQELKRTELLALSLGLGDSEEVQHERMVLERTDAVELTMNRFADFSRGIAIVAENHLAQLLAQSGTIVFEGAQGALLDEWYGFHPYTTWSTTTPENARTLLSDAGFRGQTTTVGVLRAFTTRHGAGPFPSENARLTAALPDPYNGFGAWQGGFRVGSTDTVLARYAADVAGAIDMLAITNVDRVDGALMRVTTGYDIALEDRALFDVDDAGIAVRIRPTCARGDLSYQERITNALLRARPRYHPELFSARRLVAEIASAVGAPVGIISRGPCAHHKTFVHEGMRVCTRQSSRILPAA